MLEQDKLLLDIRDIMQQMDLNEDKWQQISKLSKRTKVSLRKQMLIDTTKRTMKLIHRIII